MYLSVAAAQAIADDKVAVNILGADQSAERGELLDVSCSGGAVVNFDAVPSSGVLSGAGGNGFFDGVEPVIVRQTEGSCGRRLIAEGH